MHPVSDTLEGGSADPPPAAAAAAASAEEDAPIYAHRIGCVLHILHLAVTAGFTNPFFMGPLGKGSWHEWESDHLVALLASIWYNISRSNPCTATFKQFQNLIAENFPGEQWKTKFIRPAETRWMVIWEGAAILDERWEKLQWVFGTWAPENMLGTPSQKYWLQGAFMLNHPVFRVQARFAKELGDLVLKWAYNWLRGDGGFFVERDGTRGRLPPAMRLVEVADFALEFIARLEELRANKDLHFSTLIQFARATLKTHEVSFWYCFCVDFFHHVSKN